MTETLLVDWCTFPPLGHAIEGLQVAGAYAAANPDLAVSLLLNKRTALEVATCCPFLDSLFTVDLDVFGESFPTDSFDSVPRDWDWLHIGGYRNPESIAVFPQIARYARAADDHLTSRNSGTPARIKEWPLRLVLPATAEAQADRLLSIRAPVISILLTGGGARELYPSPESWQLLLSELHRTMPTATFVFLGKTTGYRPGSVGTDELAELVDAVGGINCCDLPLLVQLAIVHRSAFLFSPHSGFGFAALAVGTPWLTLSGGPYPEYFHIGTPFWSLLPDTHRFPAFGSDTAYVADDDGSGPRIPSMTRARIVDTLPELAVAADSLSGNRRTYEECLAAYFPALLAALGGHPERLGSWDRVHERFVR